MAAMNVYSEVKRFYTSLQEMVGLRRRKRQLQISEPFDFKKETVVLPGLTEDE
ncbi:9c2fd302-a5fe-4045-996b-7cd1385ffa46 [Thermothielavioides terrestris]|uniref:9c2fd302-a5fe-4045-996b-7cd1385ffa46 n=1 Tax=Thermothielavioides terrestris TaxID=2587410 RepID=A0A3S4F0K0_9PEZI|nr:9c2fd302-a5fe-4045-996b-7cd1385ffa46 [Thermothielavioides terrestris]